MPRCYCIKIHNRRNCYCNAAQDLAVSYAQVNSMGIVKLNERERLIERILRMPDEDVAVAAKFLDTLYDDISPDELARQTAMDIASIEASKGETGISLDDFLHESGISRQEAEDAARAEGWLKDIYR